MRERERKRERERTEREIKKRKKQTQRIPERESIRGSERGRARFGGWGEAVSWSGTGYNWSDLRPSNKCLGTEHGIEDKAVICVQ